MAVEMTGSAIVHRGIAGRLSRQKLAMAAAVVLGFMLSCAVLAPQIEAAFGIDPDTVNLFARLQAPDAVHPLGTDELGRDLLARLLEGGRVSLAVGLSGALLAAVIGTFIGLVAGFFGGVTDAVLMRLTDAVLALPLLPLLIVLAAIDPRKIGLGGDLLTGETASVYRIVVIVALFGWTTVARLVRGAALSHRRRDFVRAARAMGAGPWRIMFVHVLPSIASPIIVAASLSIGNIILTESVLSFLGLGIQPPLASWGGMLTNAQELIWQAPHLAWYPGLLIFVAVIAFNLMGDGLQRALDPRATPAGS